MTVRDLETVLAWAAAEGWNPGLSDAAAFLVADPAGFSIWDEDGIAVAAISVVNHDAANAFLGLYICHPDWRGKGVGFKLWIEALKHAGSRGVGLDGVAAQQANYAKSGFVLTGSTIRFEGTLPPETSPNVRDATPADLAALLALDQLATGYRRENFITAWTAQSDARQTLVFNDLSGFATIRLCQSGCKIGPVIASSATDAVALIKAAAAQLPNRPLIIDLPDARADLIAALTTFGFQETFRTARMYRGTKPETNGTTFAIATMELG